MVGGVDGKGLGLVFLLRRGAALSLAKLGGEVAIRVRRKQGASLVCCVGVKEEIDNNDSVGMDRC